MPTRIKLHDWRVFGVTLAVIGAASLALYTASSRSTLTASSDPMTAESDVLAAYDAKATGALIHAASDEFSSYFVTLRRVPLRIALTGVDRVVVSPSGDIYVLDLAGQTVMRLDKSGAPVGRIGAPGNRPGTYTFPTGIAQLPNGLAILDMRPARLSTFDLNGRFVDSFSYSAYRLAGLAVCVDRTTHEPYLLGKRNVRDEQKDTMVHSFGADGTYRWSALPLPTSDGYQDRDRYYEPLCAATPDGLVTTFSYEDALFSVSRTGGVSRFQPTRDRRPHVVATTRLPLHPEAVPEQQYRSFQAWAATWSPTVGLAASANTVLTERQTFDPLRYELSIWSRDGSGHLRDTAVLHTNHFVLTTTPAGEFVFLENLERRGEAVFTLVFAAPVADSAGGVAGKSARINHDPRERKER